MLPGKAGLSKVLAIWRLRWGPKELGSAMQATGRGDSCGIRWIHDGQGAIPSGENFQTTRLGSRAIALDETTRKGAQSRVGLG